MADIYFGLAAVAMVSVGAFWIARHAALAGGKAVSTTLAFVGTVGMFYFTRSFWHNVDLARILPYSNLIVIGNWASVVTAFLAGLVWHSVEGGRVRRGVLVAALGVVGLIAIVAPIAGTSPRCGNSWTWQGYCIQTTRYTCSAASAATLLRLHGIETTEQEMADLCFTRKGTTWPGLFRGLKRKTSGTPWDVEVVSGDLNDLRNLASSPIILTVGLQNSNAIDAAERGPQGWIPGVNHSVVLLEFIETDYVVIADPTPGIGRELWHISDLERVWQNVGMRLVER